MPRSTEPSAVLSRRTTHGGEWYDELQAAVKSMNATEHSALFNRDPDDVAGDKDLEFDLRYKIQYPQDAKRPRNSRMNTTKFKNTFMLEFPQWENEVEDVISQIIKEL